MGLVEEVEEKMGKGQVASGLNKKRERVRNLERENEKRRESEFLGFWRDKKLGENMCGELGLEKSFV